MQNGAWVSVWPRGSTYLAPFVVGVVCVLVVDFVGCGATLCANLSCCIYCQLGYGFVATPSPAPGVDMSPITTWGRIDGTPMLLDPTLTPFDTMGGPSFKVPEPPAREKLAMKLAEKVAIQKRKKTMSGNRTPGVSASPSRLASPLTPAGQSLLRTLSSQKTGVSADFQLRASYKSPLPSRQLRTPTFTPSPAKRTPAAGTPGSAPSTPSTPLAPRSLTDDLLNIPTTKTPKKSLTDDLM